MLMTNVSDLIGAKLLSLCPNSGAKLHKRKEGSGGVSQDPQKTGPSSCSQTPGAGPGA